jgi:hypothetical protein
MAELSPGDVLLENGGLVVSWDTGDVWQKIEKGIVKIGQVTRSSAAVLLFSATGALMDTVAILPGMEHAVIAGSSGKPATIFPYMGRTLSVAVGKGKIVLGSAERYDIREYGSAGQLVRVFQDRNADLSVTDADVGRFQQPMINRVGSDPGARRTMQNMLTQQPRPDTKPAYGRFLIDKVGNVWIADAHSLLEAPRRWIAVDEAGAIIARLDLPDRYDLYEIGTDYVLGRWIDSSGVEHVRLFGLTKEMQ